MNKSYLSLADLLFQERLDVLVPPRALLHITPAPWAALLMVLTFGFQDVPTPNTFEKSSHHTHPLRIK